MKTVALLVTVAAISASGTALARRYALARQLVDVPGERRSHSVATPRGGGVGPVVAVLAAMLAMTAAQGTPWLAAIALAAVALVGAWDDHRPLAASWRLLVHAAAGLAVAGSLFDPMVAPLLFAAVFAGVVVLINVWNFMDGINGLAASQAALVAAAVAAVDPGMRIPAIVVVVACLAFLPFNFPRARIFLGDVGSGALGLIVAWLCAGVATARPLNGLLMALPLSAFLVDAGLTLSRRMLRRERWWEPHAQHLYQGLARRHGHARVTLAYAAWTASASVASLVIAPMGPAYTMASLAVCYTSAALLWLRLQRPVATERDASS
ncbi:lipopolysaccharide biosynthesis protein [Cognatilysobacter lacus]|uniref:lipopolysaccharide biosynthesis protein n=1 Tax=Cognatilysobacter lacus TaxID=1643323 RepID=UPI0016593229|nr:lipopolysaccharide biosynthesis protein [Lysobacter lacus]